VAILLTSLGALVAGAFVACGDASSGASDGGTDAANADGGLVDGVAPGDDAGGFDGGMVEAGYLVGPQRGWARESVHRIVWRAPAGDAGDDAPVVESTLDDGVTWQPVPEEQVNGADHRVMFQVPATGGTRVRVRITDRGLVTDTGPKVLIPSQKRTYRWTKLTETAPFGPRDGTGGLVYHGRLYAIGGWNPDLHPISLTTNDVWSSADGVNWVQEKANTFLNPLTFDNNADWAGRHFGGYVVHDDKMFIVGGDPLQEDYQTDVWSSTTGKTWTRVTGKWGVTPSRAFQHVTEFLGKIWVMGGQGLSDYGTKLDPAGAYSDVWSSPDGLSWTQTMPTSGVWAPRGIIGNNAVFQGRMWIVGGGLYEDMLYPTGRYFADTWSSADGASWTREAEDPPFSPRRYNSLATFDGRLWVLGGYNDAEGNLADNWYSGDGFNWYPEGDPGLVSRHAGTVWVLDAKTMFWGSGNAFYDDGVTEKWLADMWKIEAIP
jgi:hypothetical protein